jgi:hypothetical protein
MSQNVEKLGDLPGFCDVDSDALLSLQDRIVECLDYKSSRDLLIPIRFGIALAIEAIFDSIENDLANFYDGLVNNDKLIWPHRMGYKSTYLPLNRLAETLGVAPEYIKYRECILNNQFCESVRVLPSVFSRKLRTTKSTRLIAALKNLSEVFCNDRLLLAALTMLVEDDSKEFLLDLLCGETFLA